MQQQEVCTISSIVFVRYVDPHLQCVSHVHPLLPPSAKGTQINSMYQKDMPLSAMIALLVLGAITKSKAWGPTPQAKLLMTPSCLLLEKNRLYMPPISHIKYVVT